MPVFCQPPLTMDAALTGWATETQWMDAFCEKGKHQAVILSYFLSYARASSWSSNLAVWRTDHGRFHRESTSVSACDRVFKWVLLNLWFLNSSLFWLSPPLEPKVHWPSVMKGSVHQALSHLGPVLYAEKQIQKREINWTLTWHKNGLSRPVE